LRQSVFAPQQAKNAPPRYFGLSAAPSADDQLFTNIENQRPEMFRTVRTNIIVPSPSADFKGVLQKLQIAMR